MDLEEEIVRVFLRAAKEDGVSNMEVGGLFYFIPMNVSFSITSPTHYLELRDLQQHRCIGLQIFGQKPNMGLTGLEIKMPARLCSSLDTLMENPLPS